MSPRPPSKSAPSPAPTAPPSRATAGMERVVALALAAMAVVLLLVHLDLVRAAPAASPTPFDWQNPLLFAQPGDCIEISDSTSPDLSSWLVVRAPGVVQRPYAGPATIPGWLDPAFTEPRHFLPYLLCDARRAPTAGPGKSKGVDPDKGGMPAHRDDPYVFPLNGFGMPLEALCTLSEIEQSTVQIGGQVRRCYAVGLRRYGQLDGPWVVYMSREMPVLGTLLRRYIRGPGEFHTQAFRAPESCR